ncbi:MAG: IS66 family transposase [bacterium]
MTAEKIQTATREEIVEALLSSQSRITELEHELSFLKRQLFGSKSERFVPSNDQQCTLPLDMSDEPVQEDDFMEQDISYKRRTKRSGNGKRGHSRETMPTHLPTKDIRIEPKEDVSGATHIGDDITWEYEYQRGKLFIKRYIRPKYAKPKGDGIISGTLPPRPIEKGNFGPGFIANLINEKFVYHIPLDRQRKRFFSGSNVELAESTLCGLVRQGSFWFEPVYRKHVQAVRNSPYIQVDETPIPVLVKDGRGKTHKGWFWVYYDPLSNIVVFDYQPGRGRAGPNKFLANYTGTVQVDGYTGYAELLRRTEIIWAACMAHVRRKFVESMDNDRVRSRHALKVIGIWFERESLYKNDNLGSEEKLARRVEYTVPEMKSFHQWLKEQLPQVLPQNRIGKATAYALNQWNGFEPFKTDGRIELSNNFVENAIRPVVLGRKNYLFKGSHEAAQRAAIIYSLAGTVKRHGMDSFVYFKELLTRLPGAKESEIDNYLPWNMNPEAPG